MTLPTGAVEFAKEELTHSYMPYLDEEGEPLTQDGFRQHVHDNIVGLREDGIRHSDDANALAYYLTMEEGWDEIVSSWALIVYEATVEFWENQREEQK